MPKLLINSLYPIEYFNLSGTDQAPFPDVWWWASRQRFASIFGEDEEYWPFNEGGSLTTEILELDLGRVREVNYINFDVIRAPIDIKVEYDALSSIGGPRVWTEVKPIEDMLFDNSIFYDVNSRNGWFNAEMYFTDAHGNMVHTRYIRISFTRRDEPWPTANSKPFKWSIMVKHLRVGRFIASYIDTVGPLLNQDTPANIVEVPLPEHSAGESREVRQRFVIKPEAERVGIIPRILGFGFLFKQNDLNLHHDDPDPAPMQFNWSIWDVTDNPQQLKTGTLIWDSDNSIEWADYYFKDDTDMIVTNTDRIFELRISSSNTIRCNTLFRGETNYLSSTSLPGTVNFTNGSTTAPTSQDLTDYLKAGDWIVQSGEFTRVMKVASINSTTITLTNPWPHMDASNVTINKIYPRYEWDTTTSQYIDYGDASLAIRIWADVSDEGRDILGNTYRYVTHVNRGRDVINPHHAGWMSDPKPTPDAVEALYFDVRHYNEDLGGLDYTQIDAIRIAPRTPGIKMNVYYSRENLHGEAPTTIAEWDYLLWRPATYEPITLRGEMTIDLPRQIHAAYLKLEFTELKPMPFYIPNYPKMPPKRYRRFPTWIEEQFTNTQLRNIIDDWYLRRDTAVDRDILREHSDPVKEFEIRAREFFSLLGLGKITEQQIPENKMIDIIERSVIDPVTRSKIHISDVNKYQNSLLVSIDQNSLLGKAIIARYDPFVAREPLEITESIPVDPIPFVSSSNNRIKGSYAYMVNLPMRFNKTARHAYAEETAEFNRKAFFAGIDRVELLRQDYTIPRDDKVIQDILFDNFNMEINTWQFEEGGSIPDGQTVYVSYYIGDEYIADEEITLSGFGFVKLSHHGYPIWGIKVNTLPSGLGVSYFQDEDWIIKTEIDSLGQKVHYIARNPLGERLIVPKQPIRYVDAAIVSASAHIPSPPTEDSAIITAVADVSGVEGPFDPQTYGAGTHGGGTYINMTSQHTDSDIVSSVADVSGTDTLN
ncbi:MAG: hypothetical protein QXU32_01745 [Nitrososphaerales archaeon]